MSCLNMGAQALNCKSMSSKGYSNTGGLDDNDASISGPPKVVAALSSVLRKAISKSEKLLKASKNKDVITVFHGSRAPALGIQQYIERIFKYSNLSPSCFVVAYIYMERFLHQMDVYLTSLNAHRLLITSIMLAAKFLEDECYTNAYYAKVGGISTAELNRLEMEFLVTVNFRLHVDVETFENYCLQLDEEASGKCQIDRPIKICGLGKRWLKEQQPNYAPTISGYTCRAI